MAVGPGFGCDVLDLPVGHGGQSGEGVTKIGKGIEAAPPARFDDRVEDGTAFARFGVADEEPVLLPHGGGADGIFDEVVVDLQAAILEEDEQCGPLIERVMPLSGICAEGGRGTTRVPAATGVIRGFFPESGPIRCGGSKSYGGLYFGG